MTVETVKILCDRCGNEKRESEEGWRIPEPNVFDDIILCPTCRTELRAIADSWRNPSS